MTFTKALRFKQAFKSEKITLEGLEYDILVVPAQRDDFSRYCHHYPDKTLTDESARDFCSDQQFQLMALYHDGTSVQYKKIG
jgi:hypothetical protein